MNYLITGFGEIVKWVDMMALHYELNDLIAEGRYQDNEHWDAVHNVAISELMTQPKKTFLAYYFKLLDLCEEDVAYEMITLHFNGTSVDAYCNLEVYNK